MSYCYKGFGLVFESEIPLSSLYEFVGTPQVHVTLEQNMELPPELEVTGSSYAYFDLARNQAFFFHEAVGVIAIYNGEKISVKPVPGVDEETLGLAIIAAPIRFLLHQRGLVVLHASAVAKGDSTIAFCGPSGRGKSTLAAYMQTQGFPLVTDDTLAIKVNNLGEAAIFSAAPQLRLWPETIVSLGKDPHNFPRFLEQEEKRMYEDVTFYEEEPPPLKSIYILQESWRSEMKIERVPAIRSLEHILQHSFVGEMTRAFAQNPFNDQASELKYVGMCVTLAQQVPVKLLHRSFGLSNLPQLADLIAQDIMADINYRS